MERFNVKSKIHRDRNGNFHHAVSLYDSKTKKKHISKVNYGTNELNTLNEMMKSKGYSKKSIYSIKPISIKTTKAKSKKELYRL